jgi:hypothetical protein
LPDRLNDSDGQGSIAALIIVFVVVLFGSTLASIAAAVSIHNDRQRTADLAALAGGRALNDANARAFEPRLIDGRPNPRYLTRQALLELVKQAAVDTAKANGGGTVRVRFPGTSALMPMRVQVRVSRPVKIASRAIPVAAEAEAELSVAPASLGVGGSTDGEYRGPLAMRQGKPMRPDVAQAFDRMAASARAAGVGLIINSAFRSNAEQAVLFARHPDPKWVAPPGKSLHRLATELDLGPPSAYRWLAANASRFGFKQRYSWEAWHYGYVRSAGTRSVGFGPPDGKPAIPAFVPERYAPLISAASQRWNVGAALLAAQLHQESGFNPAAVSGAGAGGIAQFMPATGRAYGLSSSDRFDPAKAIMAQAHHMHDLLKEFGSVPLALAAYNAGPLPVQRCGCVPAIAETQAYVATIMALLGGAGDELGLGAGTRVRLVG